MQHGLIDVHNPIVDIQDHDARRDAFEGIVEQGERSLRSVSCRPYLTHLIFIDAGVMLGADKMGQHPGIIVHWRDRQFVDEAGPVLSIVPEPYPAMPPFLDRAPENGDRALILVVALEEAAVLADDILGAIAGQFVESGIGIDDRLIVLLRSTMTIPSVEAARAFRSADVRWPRVGDAAHATMASAKGIRRAQRHVDGNRFFISRLGQDGTIRGHRMYGPMFGIPESASPISSIPVRQRHGLTGQAVLRWKTPPPGRSRN